MWRRGRLAIISAIKEGAAVIREGAGSQCICVGLTSMCAGSEMHATR
jgi:hypothetical protein